MNLRPLLPSIPSKILPTTTNHTRGVCDGGRMILAHFAHSVAPCLTGTLQDPHVLALVFLSSWSSSDESESPAAFFRFSCSRTILPHRNHLFMPTIHTFAGRFAGLFFWLSDDEVDLLSSSSAISFADCCCRLCARRCASATTSLTAWRARRG